MTGRANQPAGSPWTPPATFEEYRVLGRLSRGGMGEVYLGHDSRLDRPVAIKFISALEPDAWMREQFVTEARAAARVQHPNVVSVYRVGEIEGRPYIISELVRGQGLDSIRTPLAWERVLELALGLARGLAAAHRAGVLHRDIKPANAIISGGGSDDGVVKLIDFGLAELVDIEAVTGRALLTPASGILAIAQTVDLSISGVPNSSPASAPRAAIMPSLDLAYNRTPMDELAELRSGSWPGGHRPSTRIVGTPHYMAPETWLGEPSTRQSDIYAMGALLFELCTGRPPHHEVQNSYAELCHAVNTKDVPGLIELVPGIAPLFAEVVGRCLRRKPDERYASGDELREALEGLQSILQPEASPSAGSSLRSSARSIVRARERTSLAPHGNPYRGLRAFEAEHRSLFFGRTNEIGTVIERLRSEAFILITADSGIGKSSLCRAGILPLIREGAFGGDRPWQVVSLVPGRTPLSALAAALSPILTQPEAELIARLRTEPAALGRALHQKIGDDGGVILFIDQLEELVTIADPDEAAGFSQAIGRLCLRISGVRLLMTARSDFLARLATLPVLGQELARGLYFLQPMNPEKIREAIVGPAQEKGVRFESAALVDALVDETAKTDGGLPLLQFTLAELWDARSGELITRRSLEGIGGVAGALARHADQVILSLPADRRIAARRILMMLVSVEGTRARRLDAEIGTSEAARQALDALLRGRLIVACATGDDITYEVAHEALLKGWGTLRGWLEEFAESRAVKQRLELAAVEWTRLGRSRLALWSAPQLAELDILVASDLTAKEQAFIAASRRALSRSRLLRSAVVVAIPLALVLFYSGIHYKNRRERNHLVTAHLQRGEVLFSEARKKNTEVEALRKKAFAAFDAQRKDDGEKHWASALKAMQQNDALFVQASQALEAALSIDASRGDVRALLADSLFEGALAADRDRRYTRRNELMQRMGLYDAHGERQRRWQAPARLQLETFPAGARIKLQEYVEDERQHRQLTAERDLGRAPLAELKLKAGSYLLSLALPGRVPVRYPILVHRAEELRLAIELPAEKDIPEGFVYTPAGRFLFGTASDESVRQGFLSTVPIHEVAAPAFLIGRFEVTYADWLEFLNALREPERAKRMIRLPKGGIGGGVELIQLGDGNWQLTLQPTTQRFVVRPGEAIRYATRERHQEQRWLRLPVSGIAPDDVRAYAAWLDHSGRVPGARLCSEYEWERAARGADDRDYPHGNLLAPSEANFDETYGKRPDRAGPDEVASYPDSASPFGLMDIAGNVFEWTTSSLAQNEVVVRGGGYFMGGHVARSTNRTALDASFADPSIGARICASFAALSPTTSR